MPAPPSESRAKILDVAEALFAQHGYAGVGLRGVADGVGLSKSSLFHHFATKRELYDEVMARVLARLDDRLSPALQLQAGHAARLERLIDSLVDALAEHPTTARLALRSIVEGEDAGHEPITRAPYQQTLRRLIDGFKALLTEGVQAGVFREVSPGHFTQTLIGATMVHFASADFGEEIVGAPIFSADQVSERKRELKALVRYGLIDPDADPRSVESSTQPDA
jgi:AcrR family transcriptional regulator